MTAICGGGASAPQAGYTGTYVIDANYAASFLPAAFGYILPFVPYIPPITIELAGFCAVDPPSGVLPTATALAGLLAGQPEVEALAAGEALAVVIAQYAWYHLCECTVVATPVAPAPPPAPVGLPQLNPTGVVSGPGGACGSFDWSARVTVYTGLDTGEAATSAPIPIPLGATSVRLTSVWGPGDGQAYFPGSTHWMLMSAVIGSVGGIFGTGGNFGQGTVPGLTDVTTFTILPGTASMIVDADNQGEAVPNTVTVHGDFFCGGLSGNSACTTDPAVIALLNRIMGLVTGLYQQPGTPTSYAESTVHAGLTGAGSIAIAPGTIAVRVNMTADTTGYRVSTGVPSFYFNRGYIVPLTTEGPQRAVARLDYNPQLYVLPLLTVSLGYTLPVGLVVSITELVAGP